MSGKHGKHRTRSRQVRKITALGAATATATALTITAIPLAEPAEDGKKAVEADVRLAAALNNWPDPDQIPDLTGGLGTAVYDFGQTFADVILRLIVENFNAAALAQAVGADPDSVLDALLGGVLAELPANLLDDIVGRIPLDVSGLIAAIINPLGLEGLLLDQVVAALAGGVLPDTLGGLLGLLGIDLSDVLNLSDLNTPGVNIVTAGPVFTLLKLLGADLGWVPGLPNSVADELINSSYLPVEVKLGGLLTQLLPAPLVAAISLLPGIDDELDLNAINLRVSTLVGIGLGAFAAGMALDQVIDNLPDQPGGGGPNAVDSVLGSYTILPAILLRNPGRANGGLFARFYPIARLFGIDTVTPETEVTSRGGIPLLNTGLSLGGANLIPVKVDGTVMYDPLSDFAAWPNPVSLVNNLFAGFLPTYILRGLDTETIPEQLQAQLDALLPEDYDGGSLLRLNLYLTLESATLPLLEPLYLASDVLNLMTFGAFPVNPFNLIANALAPALTSLTNLGYTDVVYDPETGGYVRTLTESADPTPFLSFPNVDWQQVPGVIINQFIQGIQKEFFSGNPTPGTPNALSNLIDGLLSGTLGSLLGGLPLGNVSGLVQSILDTVLGSLTGGLVPLAQARTAALPEATSLPDANARTMLMSTESLDGGAESGFTASEFDGVATQSAGADTGGEDSTGEEGAGDEGAGEEGAGDEGGGDEGGEDSTGDQGGEDSTDDEGTDDEGDGEESGDEGDGEESGDEGADEESTTTTGPKHAKPDDSGTVTSIGGSAPRHAKPDNDAGDGGTTGDAGGDSTGGASGAVA